MKNKLTTVAIMLLIMIFTMIVMPSFVYAAKTVDLKEESNYNYGNVTGCSKINTTNGKTLCKISSNTKFTCVEEGYEIFKTNINNVAYGGCRQPKNSSSINYIDKNIDYGASEYSYGSTYDNSQKVNCVLKSGNSIKVSNSTPCYIDAIDSGKSVVMEYDYKTYTTNYYRYNVIKGIESLSQLDNNYDYGNVKSCTSNYSTSKLLDFDGLKFCGISTSVNDTVVTTKCENSEYQIFSITFSVNGKNYKGTGCRKPNKPENEISSIVWNEKTLYVGESEFIPDVTNYFNGNCQIINSSENGVAELSINNVTNKNTCVINAKKSGVAEVKFSKSGEPDKYFRYTIIAAPTSLTDLDSNYIYGNVDECDAMYTKDSDVKKIFDGKYFCGTSIDFNDTITSVTCENSSYEKFNTNFVSSGNTYKGIGCRCLKGSACDSSTNNGNNPQVNELRDCSSLLGSPKTEKSPAWYLSLVFSIMRYAAIILLVVLSIMDFVGAVASQDNDILKKATTKVIKRAIICVIIFVLPTLIDFVLQFIHNTSISDCIDLSN